MTTRHLASVQQAERTVQTPATITVSLPAETDHDAAKRAVAALVARHELLRSRLVPATYGSARMLQEMCTEVAVAWRPSDDAEWAHEAGVAGSPVRVHLSETRPLRIRLTIPSSYADMGVLLIIARELRDLAAGREVAEPVQNSQYAAWQADNEESRTEVPGPPLPPVPSSPGWQARRPGPSPSCGCSPRTHSSGCSPS